MDDQWHFENYQNLVVACNYVFSGVVIGQVFEVLSIGTYFQICEFCDWLDISKCLVLFCVMIGGKTILS